MAGMLHLVIRATVVLTFKAGADGGPPPYRLKTETVWESREKLDAAVANQQTQHHLWRCFQLHGRGVDRYVG